MASKDQTILEIKEKDIFPTETDNMVSKDQTTSEITSFSSLDDFLKTFQDENVNKYIESITYDVKSQTMIIEMQKLLENEADKRLGNLRKERRGDLADEKIRQLSVRYRKSFPVLLNSFKEWKPVREKLIEILSTSSNNLDRNFVAVSVIRIITSAADIFGTLARTGGKPDTSWANFAMEHASTLGLLFLVAEKTLSKKMLKRVKNAMKLDQELFRKIADWFKQTEELDNAVKSFFPYGIDEEIAKKIAQSASSFDDCNKIFMSIVATNVKENVKLFKDEMFLDKADQFANSEAGKHWFHKLIVKYDPNFSHHLNSQLNEDIQSLLKNSSIDNPEFYVDGCRVLSSKVKMKVTLNLITIMSAGSNLLFWNKPEESDVLKELSEKTQEELEGIKKVVRCLNPSHSELDDVLL